jgi:hypothetical protein
MGHRDPFTGRDAAAAPFDHVISRETPRDPASWPEGKPLPLSQSHMDIAQMGKALSTLGKTAGRGILEHAQQAGIAIPPELSDHNAHPSTEQTVAALRSIAVQVFPRLAART